jgi:3-oxoacyl-[acyl-carrier-protein] synthase-1
MPGAKMKPLAVAAFTATSALGRGNAPMLEALRRGTSGLRPNDFDRAELRAWIGRVPGLEDAPVAGSLAEFDCRNNRLAQLGLAQDGFRDCVSAAKAKYGAKRIAVLLGTSTSGILQTELAYRARDSGGALPQGFDYRHGQNLFSVTDFVRRALGLEGPAMTISTACSSSAKVFASAWRTIEAGVADAAVVGGVDSLCLTTLHGFASLQLVADEPCRPFDAARKGMSIGEAAGFALLEREGPIALAGYGESSDAHHMSTPHPEGEGALSAMRQALERAGLEPSAIDYVNAHGTATPANDRAEDRALVRLFGDRVPVSSTKGWTGHTLGAAGIVEAIVCFLALEHGFIPRTLNTSVVETGLESQIALQNRDARVRAALTNSFGFGGSNCSLVFAA